MHPLVPEDLLRLHQRSNGHPTGFCIPRGCTSLWSGRSAKTDLLMRLLWATNVPAVRGARNATQRTTQRSCSCYQGFSGACGIAGSVGYSETLGAAGLLSSKIRRRWSTAKFKQASQLAYDGLFKSISSQITTSQRTSAVASRSSTLSLRKLSRKRSAIAN